MISDEIKDQLVAQDRGTGDLGLVGSCENARAICTWSEQSTDAANYGTSTVVDITHVSVDVDDPSIETKVFGNSLFVLGEYGLSTFDDISYEFKDINPPYEFSTGSGWPPPFQSRPPEDNPHLPNYHVLKLIEDSRTNRDVTRVVEFLIEFDFSSIGTPPVSDIATSDPITYNLYVDTANEKAYRKDRISFVHTVRNYSFRKFTTELAAVTSGEPVTTLARPEWSPPLNTNGLAKGKDKLLGNISTGNLNTIDSTESFPETFPKYWNSAIAGNVCKWRPVERNQGEFDFSGADILQKLCKDNDLKMIWHTLLWGANQGHPDWFVGLSEADSKAAVQTWFGAVADRYGDDIYGIQVANELIPGHQALTETVLKPQLGGAGETGYDWIIWVYEQARHYFPNAILWTNDYAMMNNTSNAASNRSYMYGVANALKDRELVDAFGMQSHYFNSEDLTALEVTNILNEVYDQTGLPIHITELDLSGTDQEQLLRYQTIFPAMWNHPAVDRVNLWGWITGETWRHDQGYVTGLIDRDGTNKRPAFEWLEEFFDFEDSSTAESNETDSSTSNINYTSYWQKV
jgi:endo-1,4-beta-xylanase